MLGDQREVSIRGVVEHRGGEEAARGGDESRGRSLSSPRRDDLPFKNAFEGRNVDERVGVDVDVVVFAGDIGEESLPQRGELERRVSEEEEGDFGAAAGGGEVGFGGGEVGLAAGEIGGVHGDGFVEEREVVELIGEGDGDLAWRQESRGQEEEQNG